MTLQVFQEFFKAIGISNQSPKQTFLQFPMQWNRQSNRRTFFSQNYMTSSLPIKSPTSFDECFNCLFSRNDRKFNHLKSNYYFNDFTFLELFNPFIRKRFQTSDYSLFDVLQSLFNRFTLRMATRQSWATNDVATLFSLLDDDLEFHVLELDKEVEKGFDALTLVNSAPLINLQNQNFITNDAIKNPKISDTDSISSLPTFNFPIRQREGIFSKEFEFLSDSFLSLLIKLVEETISTLANEDFERHKGIFSPFSISASILSSSSSSSSVSSSKPRKFSILLLIISSCFSIRVRCLRIVCSCIDDNCNLEVEKSFVSELNNDDFDLFGVIFLGGLQLFIFTPCSKFKAP
mgnify:CR=1 FL=1